MAVIARCNGTALVEDGPRLGVVEQGGGWLGTAVFIAALVALLALVNAVLLFTIALAAGVAVLAVALVAGFVAHRLWRRRRVLAASPAAEAPWLVFDREAGVLRDGDGAALSPLREVRLARAFQAGSSSKALRVQWRGGAKIIARGTPFGDSVDAVEHALRARGIGG